MTTIKKKIWPKYFDDVKKGVKTYELRLADFDCRPGDILILQEWDQETKKYTGRELKKTVTYVGKTKDYTFWSDEEIDKYGYQIIALGDELK